MLSAERLQAFVNGLRQQLGFDITGAILPRASWMIGGQIDRWNSAVYLLSPEAQRLFRCFAGEPFLLPESEVGKLKGKVGQVGRAILRISRIQLGKILHENAIRPAVANNVMHGAGKKMVLVAQMNQMGKEKRTGGEIHGDMTMLAHYIIGPGLSLLYREPAKIRNGEAVERGF